MNAHDRIWKTCSHEEPDQVPTFAQHIESPFIQKFNAQFHSIDGWARRLHRQFVMKKQDLGVAWELGLDSKWNHSGAYLPNLRDRPDLSSDLKEKFKNKSISTDGHVYERVNGENWYVDGVLKTPELIRDWISYIKTFKPGPTVYWKYIRRLWDIGCAHDMVPIPTAGGPTYTTWSSIGLDRVAYIIRKYPQLFKDLHSAWTDIAIEMHKCIFEQGIDMVFFCDDHCYKDRCMFSVDQFDQFFTDNFRRMADNAHKYGAKVFLHSDGNLTQEIPSLIRAGIDACEPLEFEAGNRLKPIKEKYGDKITFIGNVAASDVLSHGTVEDTITLTKQCILDAAEGGGYILAPGSDVLGTIKVENFKTMIATAKKYGHYPINHNLF